VDVARGTAVFEDTRLTLVDLPGSYSLLSHSAEEEIARDFVCFGDPDVAVVVCDASCLERNLNLALQVIEAHPKTLLCVNLMDEARKKRIHVDLNRLSSLLRVPVCGCTARSGEGMDALLEKMALLANPDAELSEGLRVTYSEPIENAIAKVAPAVLDAARGANLPERWLALRLLEGDRQLLDSLRSHTGIDPSLAAEALAEAKKELAENGIAEGALRDTIVNNIYQTSARICAEAVHFEDAEYNRRQLRVDRLLTSRATGVFCMLLLLALVFWITLVGANTPSDWLYALFQRGEGWLNSVSRAIGCPEWLHGLLITGAYRVAAWVVAVMLPPMAFCLPLFTLLDDVGNLPRVAVNL